MRDRRNTNLSTSSTGSTQSSPVSDPRQSLNEKRYTSPPPDDGLLPLPVTKENKSRHLSRRSLAVRVAIAFCALLLFIRCFVGSPTTSWKPIAFEHDAVATTEKVDGENELASEPTALVVTDGAGHQRWTVSIPSDAHFPLRAGHYQDICTHAEALSSNLRAKSKLAKIKGWRKKGAYSAKEPEYMEVAEAQRSGILPTSPHYPNETVCESSLTFAMDTTDASFGKTLLMLWMSYGLAKKEGRAFFIDDTRWPYGKYDSYFTPPPAPKCARPPPLQIVPCPHSAQHVVVSAATAQWTFGPSFDAEYAPLRKHGLDKSRNVYALARAGYEDLFHLIGEDANYAETRETELQASAGQQPTISLQIRRGDLHPFEFEFSRDYLPLDQYTTAARTLLSHISPTSHADSSRSLFLASDDPALISNKELMDAASPLTLSPAQTRIQLATKAALDRSSPAEDLREPGSAYTKHIDENAGWDGGFYSSLFYSLGSGSTSAAAARAGEEEVLSDQTMRLRELVGRGYLLDLAIMGGSDGVVCGVSSAGCRILGVMMGWDAVKDGRWVNVDDGRAWSWDGRRW